MKWHHACGCGGPGACSGKGHLSPSYTKEEEVENKSTKSTKGSAGTGKGKVKFEVYGEEMLEKKVSLSGNSGRIYLPPDWVGRHVKIIRID